MVCMCEGPGPGSLGVEQGGDGVRGALVACALPPTQCAAPEPRGGVCSLLWLGVALQTHTFPARAAWFNSFIMALFRVGDPHAKIKGTNAHDSGSRVKPFG